MDEVVLHGTVRSDGSLELSERVNLPPGQVRVTVRPERARGEDPLAVLRKIWAERQALGSPARKREEIDAQIEAIRAEWGQ